MALTSEKIFPKRERLDKLELNELEGYRSDVTGHRETLLEGKNKNELLIKYHLALEAAETELKKYYGEER